MNLNPTILQICPHDTAPFDALCRNVHMAAQAADIKVHSVFLAPAHAEPLPFATYFNIDDLAAGGTLRQVMRQRLSDPVFEGIDWDLVLCHRYRAYRALVASKLPKAKSVVIAHEYGLLDKWQRRLHRLVLAPSVRFAGVSPPVAKALAKITDQAIVIGNTLDVAAADNQLLSKSEALAELGLPEGPPTIAVVGRLHYKKRPDLALQAYQLLCKKHQFEQPPRLVFLGTGDLERGLRARAGYDVHFSGHVPNAARLYSAFDAVLYPAVADSFGMVVLEALFAGVPVVTQAQHGPQYVLGPLGTYAADDTPEAYAHALAETFTLDRDHYATAARARIEQHFSLTTLQRTLQQLISEVTPEEDIIPSGFIS